MRTGPQAYCNPVPRRTGPHFMRQAPWSVVVGGGLRVAVGGGWRWVAVGSGWRLVFGGGGCRRRVAGGRWRVAVGGWWRLAVGNWRLAIRGPWGLSLKKKMESLRTALTYGRRGYITLVIPEVRASVRRRRGRKVCAGPCVTWPQSLPPPRGHVSQGVDAGP